MTNTIQQICRIRICRRAANGTLAFAILLLSTFVITGSAQAQTLTVLHAFTGMPDGKYPHAGLIGDSAGNLYGTTQWGGAYDRGTVFEVDATGKETVLYSFKGKQGTNPQSGLIRDGAGNLYGVAYGGPHHFGTVFELNAAGKLKVLHTFESVADGYLPFGGLIRDSAGNLYGTTVTGGPAQYGTVFKLDATGTFTVLHNFAEKGGYFPYAGLTRDAAGNLYGTASSGGPFRLGSVFELDATGKFTVLHSFAGADGAHSYAGLIRDSAGNIYGVTRYGGDYDLGTVFKLDATGKETVLYSFTGTPDGAYPVDNGRLFRDSAGNLYGTTYKGGAYDLGTVFKLDATGKETMLYSFTGGADGSSPEAGLIGDADGNLYGATYNGGASGFGTVFKLAP